MQPFRGSLLSTAALCLTVVSFIGTASAQIANSNDPIQVTSTRDAVYSRSEGIFTYTENVRVVQGGSRLASDTLRVYCSQDQAARAEESCDPISRIVAEGQVVFTTPNEKIRGDRAEYNFAADTITITGVVIMSRGADGVVRGTRVVYDVTRGLVTITSDNEPVFSIFTPQRRDEATPPGNN